MTTMPANCADFFSREKHYNAAMVTNTSAKIRCVWPMDDVLNTVTIISNYLELNPSYFTQGGGAFLPSFYRFFFFFG